VDAVGEWSIRVAIAACGVVGAWWFRRGTRKQLDRAMKQLDLIADHIRDDPERAEKAELKLINEATVEAVAQRQASTQEIEEEILRTAPIRQAIGETIAGLPEDEKLLVTLYYYEELPLEEIAEVLSVTPNQASEIHTRAILRLKSRLHKRRRPLAELRQTKAPP
jgi:RNA polymerase sigma factor (sigma-70 family)